MSLINTTRWLRLRRNQLSKHPLCERCEAEGLVVPAREVHHVVPCELAHGREEMQRLMYDPANLMSLCHRCHVAVHRAMGKGSKKETKQRAKSMANEVMRKFFGDDYGTVSDRSQDQG